MQQKINQEASHSRREETSYGGVVIRENPASKEAELIVIKPRGKAALALPKGGADPDETPADTAVREVREETGAIVSVRGYLGDVQYWYSRNSHRIFKTVRFYLCDYVEEAPHGHDPDEVDEVHWIPLKDARQRLSYPGERALIERALDQLDV